MDVAQRIAFVQAEMIGLFCHFRQRGWAVVLFSAESARHLPVDAPPPRSPGLRLLLKLRGRLDPGAPPTPLQNLLPKDEVWAVGRTDRTESDAADSFSGGPVLRRRVPINSMYGKARAQHDRAGQRFGFIEAALRA